jgi:hypothetical protein
MFWFFLLPVLIIVPFLADFIYMPGAQFSDLAISHAPNAIFLRQALENWRQIPLWSNTILGGYPFAADPLSGLWYPPGWLGIVLPIPLGFNLAFALHLVWAGLGMYLFLRAEGKNHLAAVMGGLAFELLPKLFSHYAAGHVTLAYAVTWTPWILWAEKRALLRERRSLLPAAALAVTALADVRWAALAGLLWVAYAIYQRWPRRHVVFIAREDAGIPAKQLQGRLWRDFGRLAGYLVVQVLLAVLMAAPLIFPLVQYTSLSTRVGLTPQESAVFSLPPSRLLGLLYPDIGGNAEFILYSGGLALILAILAFYVPIKRRDSWFWGLILLAALLISLGTSLPFWPVLAHLPGFGLLRVPSRALFLAGFAFSVLTGYGGQALLESHPHERLKGKPEASLLIVALAAFTCLMAAAIGLVTRSLPLNFMVGAISILLAAVWTLLRKSERLPGGVWAAGALVLLLVNLGLVDRLSIVPKAPNIVFADGSEVASYLASQPGEFRVYSPSYSLPQQTAVRYGLQLVEGVDPLQLTSFTDFMRQATGVPMPGYSVTMPPLEGDDPSTANAAYLPDPEKLGLLNVRYVVSEFDLVEDGLMLRARLGSTRVYENLDAMPRAWLQQSDGTVAPPQDVTLVRQTANEIDIFANGGGRLVLSEIAYPGWRVWVDGRESQVQTYNGVLRSVVLSPGPHQISFIFRPKAVILGLAFGAAAWLGFAFYSIMGILLHWRNKRNAG